MLDVTAESDNLAHMPSQCTINVFFYTNRVYELNTAASSAWEEFCTYIIALPQL